MEENKYPILLRACLAERFGRKILYNGGLIAEAGFIYLLGEPDKEWLEKLRCQWSDRMFVCVSQKWEQALLEKYPGLICTIRFEMKALKSEHLPAITSYMLPESFQLTPFGKHEFELHPFYHGSRYSNYEEFEKYGSGAVIWHEGKIVASASSFLSYQKEVEVDVFTQKEYRRRGFAAACVAYMLADCQKKGITAHWDAQNIASRHLAEKLGYRLERDYKAYSFLAPEEP